MVILVSTVVAMSAVAQLWEDEWEVLLISLQVSGGGRGVLGSCLRSTFQTRQAFCRSRLSKGPEGAESGLGHLASQSRVGGYSSGFLHPKFPPWKNGDRVACSMGRDRLSGCW